MRSGTSARRSCTWGKGRAPGVPNPLPMSPPPHAMATMLHSELSPCGSNLSMIESSSATAHGPTSPTSSSSPSQARSPPPPLLQAWPVSTVASSARLILLRVTPPGF
jgi:hypothetical protein